MNFDKALNRKGTSSLKWDYLERFYGDDDIVPMWVADSDFEVPEKVKEVLVKRAEHGAFGYTGRPKEFYNAFIKWVDKRYSWEIKKEHMIITPGIVAAINWAIQTYTQEGDKIIVQSPVYYPFFYAIENNQREIVDNTLVLKDNKYVMDFDRLIEQIDDKTKMIILCSPHNPVTRVWTREELKILGEICVRNDILIISDEIHSDLILEGNVHTPIATVSPEIADLTITMMAPSKTFNVAGLETSTVIITNKELRDKFKKFQQSIGMMLSNIFGIEAFTACYKYGEKWLDAQLKYIKGNVEYVKEFVGKNMAKLNVIDPEGTYLVWMDCSELKYNDAELKDFFVKKVKVALNMGDVFGEESGGGYVRFNLATQKENVKQVMESFKEQYDIRIKEIS